MASAPLIDASIACRLLSVEADLLAMPDDADQAKRLADEVARIPGVAACTVQPAPSGTVGEGPPSSAGAAATTESANRVVLPLGPRHRSAADWLVVELADPDQFAAYEPCVRRLARVPEAHERAPAPEAAGDGATELSLALERARKAEQQLRLITDKLPGYVAYVTLDDLVYRFVNHAFEVGFGRPRETIVGRHIRDVIGPSNYEFALPYIDEVRAGREASYENTFALESGRRWIKVNYVPDFGPEGEVIGIVVLSYDITDRKKAEQALEESEGRFRLLSESSPMGAFQTDADGRVLFTNRRWQEITGMGLAESLGFGWTRALHPDDLRRVQAEWAECLREGTGYAGAFRFVRPSGEVRWVHTRTAPIRLEGGEVVGHVGANEDITEQRRLEAELVRAQKLESVGVLAGGIAHDFNNLLTAMFAHLSLAKLHTNPGSDLSDLLRQAELACERAAGLTQQLLTFAKGGAPIKRTIALAPLLRDSVRFALRGSAVSPTFTIDDSLPPIECDEGQLSQVFHNLTINADEAMPEGGRLLVSAESVTREDGGAAQFVRVAFDDAGVGIPESILPKVFDPYFTTKQKGSGLGLATSYAIVDKHGGHISLRSVPNEGTSVEIYLPAAAAPASSVEPVERTPTGGGRVLVMDDEILVRQGAGRLLAGLGYEADLVEDGAAAIEKVREAERSGTPYLAAILDLTVPGGMGGRACMQVLREAAPNLPTIVSSGYSTDPVMANYREHGFAGVLPKPFGIQQLAEMLAQIEAMSTPRDE